MEMDDAHERIVFKVESWNGTIYDLQRAILIITSGLQRGSLQGSPCRFMFDVK